MSLISVEGHSNLKKDTSSGGVVNVDNISYQNYLAAKRAATQRVVMQERQSENIQSLQTEINSMKSDLNDIKTILVQLLEKGK